MDEILLIDKPKGMSSFLVVAKIRGMLLKVINGGEIVEENGALREKLYRLGDEIKAEYLKKGEQLPKRIKVGHAGTLDPFATGLLIVLVGRSTKRAGEFLKLDKEYIAELKFGEVSTTGDPEGKISGISDRRPSKEEVEMVVSGFVGRIKQRVPAFSAVKIQGKRAYDLARKGIAVEMPVKDVEVYEIEILSYEYPKLRIRTKVSSGTYIRALGEDIGEKLGVGAYLTELRRTKIADYDVQNAI